MIQSLVDFLILDTITGAITAMVNSSVPNLMDFAAAAAAQSSKDQQAAIRITNAAMTAAQVQLKIFPTFTLDRLHSPLMSQKQNWQLESVLRCSFVLEKKMFILHICFQCAIEYIDRFRRKERSEELLVWLNLRIKTGDGVTNFANDFRDSKVICALVNRL